MKSFWHLMDSRRSIRAFKDIPVEQSKWGKLLTCVALAPSSGNLHNVRCIVVQEQKKRELIAHLCYDQLWVAQAPIIFILTADKEYAQKFYGKIGKESFTIQDVSAVAMLMSLSAHEMGLASCWVSSFDEARLKHELKIPASVDPFIVLPIGYSAEEVPTPARPPAHVYSYMEEYGNKIEDLNIVFQRYGARLEKKSAHVYQYFTDLWNNFAKKNDKK
jgi:nitroreductase